MSLNTPDADDTAFYAHLTSQILLLMDEDDVTHAPTTRNVATEYGARPVGGGLHLVSGKYFGWLDGGRSDLWACNGGGGTGVFIPRVAGATKPRRKRHHKSRKNKSEGRMDSSAG